jgi:hypothetical protein
VTRLQARELSAEEAFIIATKRIGSAARLGAEFGKMNSQSAWIDRLFWGVILMQMWSVAQVWSFSLSEIFSRLAGISTITQVNNSHNSPAWLATVGQQMMVLIPMAVAGFLIWRLFKSPQNRLKAILEDFSNQPAILAGIALGANVLFHALYVATYVLGDPSILQVPLITYFKTLPLYLFYSGVIFFLARKRLLKKA